MGGLAEAAAAASAVDRDAAGDEAVARGGRAPLRKELLPEEEEEVVHVTACCWLLRAATGSFACAPSRGVTESSEGVSISAEEAGEDPSSTEGAASPTPPLLEASETR